MMDKPQFTDRERRIIALCENLNNVFRHEHERNEICFIDIQTIDENYFVDLLKACHLQFNRLTGNQADLIEFIGILNKLAVQHLLESKAELTEGS